jgi:glucokinase
MSAAEIFASTDVRARHLIEETLVELSVHVANFAISIDPARIAVGGGLMSVSELILPVLASRIRRAVPFPPEIVAARFVHDGALRGAASLALAAAHSDRMDESINQL